MGPTPVYTWVLLGGVAVLSPFIDELSAAGSSRQVEPGWRHRRAPHSQRLS
jgi:hypothetical protein